jgi:hypothetical protein
MYTFKRKHEIAAGLVHCHWKLTASKTPHRKPSFFDETPDELTCNGLTWLTISSAYCGQADQEISCQMQPACKNMLYNRSMQAGDIPDITGGFSQ